MPRLGSLLVCEKIISDQAGKPTLISLFQKMSALVPKGQQVPKDMIAGAQWSVFSEWFFTTGERTNQYEQVLEVVLPDGSQSPIRGRLLLKDLGIDDMGSRVFVNMFGVPVAQEGAVTVRVWLEVNSERVTDVFPYKIIIEHTDQPPTLNDGGSQVPTLSQQVPKA